MAIRRMYAKSVIDTDKFMEMPMSTQCLYFHLLLYGDDDGFVASPKRIMRLLGASEDDMWILIAKEYILAFESGIIVIRHWRVHNKIRNDRYSPTVHNERSLLVLDENNVYQLLPSGSESSGNLTATVGIPCGNQSDNHTATIGIPDGEPDDNQMEPDGETCGIPSDRHTGNQRGPKDRIGKDRLGKDSIGEVREDEDRSGEMDSAPPYDEILVLYHSLCHELLPAKVLTPQRKRAMAELYALLGGSLEAIKDYFQRCADTPFLCGKNRDGWRANLDFLLDPSKYANIVEGKYDVWREPDGRNGTGVGDSGKSEREISPLDADYEAFEKRQKLPGDV